MELNPRIPGHFIQLKAQESPERVIFTFEGWSTETADEVVTYRRLWENSAKVAHELARQGLQPRDTFAIFMRNHPEFIYAILGGSVAGCVFVPIDPRQKGDKLRYQLQHAECKAVVTTTDLLPAVEALLPQLSGLRVILASQRPDGPPAAGALVRSYQDVLAEPLRSEPEQRVTDMSHPIQVIYTSGTTGDPKGVVAETGRWSSTAGMVGAVFGYTKEDRLYTGLSLTHGNAQVVTFLAGLYNDVPAVFSPRFTKSKIWDICRRYGCTTFSLLGGMMAAIYAEPRRLDDSDNPVRFVLSAGTPRAIWEDFEKRFNTRILEWYGAVEGGFAFKPIGQGPIGSFGRPIPGVMEMKIVDEDDHVDLGKVKMNYATVGDASKPALLLIPGQTESWWGYEQALPLLAVHFNAFAVDLRGQGRSTRTPRRYTLDNMGNDLVRFIDLIIGRPTFVSGLSSGGVLSAWLSAYAKPGQVIAAHYEDPPLFASEVQPAIGPGIRQGIRGIFHLWSTFLGNQWSIGDWDGMRAAAADYLPLWMQAFPSPDEPPQNLKEYDPEWAHAFWTGTVAASCDHERMLRSVKAPVLFTHHFRRVDEATGFVMGALSDLQAQRARALLTEAGVTVDYRSFEQMGHSMHGQDPQLFTETLVEWVSKQPTSR